MLTVSLGAKVSMPVKASSLLRENEAIIVINNSSRA